MLFLCWFWFTTTTVKQSGPGFFFTLPPSSREVWRLILHRVGNPKPRTPKSKAIYLPRETRDAETRMMHPLQRCLAPNMGMQPMGGGGMGPGMGGMGPGMGGMGMNGAGMGGLGAVLIFGSAFFEYGFVHIVFFGGNSFHRFGPTRDLGTWVVWDTAPGVMPGGGMPGMAGMAGGMGPAGGAGMNPMGMGGGGMHPMGGGGMGGPMGMQGMGAGGMAGAGASPG